MDKIERCREGIAAAWQIYSSPSFFSRLCNATHALSSMRFTAGSAVAYVYESSEKQTMYIVLIYNISKRNGNGKRVIDLIKKYAYDKHYRIVVTTSKRSHLKDNADKFYLACGFLYLGDDEKHSYYSVEDVNKPIPIKLPENKNYIQKQTYALTDHLAVILVLITYPFGLKNRPPIVVEKMDEWFANCN